MPCARPPRTTRSAHYRLVEPTLPGSRNGGDILVHLRFDAKTNGDPLKRDFAATLADAATTRSQRRLLFGRPHPQQCTATGTVYRTLLLRVLPTPTPTPLPASKMNCA